MILLVFAGGLLAAAQFGKISLTLVETAAAYDRPVTSISILVSLVGIAGLLLGPMAGGITASIGAGRTYLGGLVLGGALAIVQAILPPFTIMAGLRAAEGLPHLALVVSGPPLMAAAASDRARPFVMGLWAVFFGTSIALSAQAFPPILASGGLPLLFALNGVGLLIVAGLLWRRVPRAKRMPVTLDPIAVHRAIYGRIRYMAPGLGFVCYTFLFIAVISVLPDALERPGLATTLPLITLCSTLAGGALSGRFAPHHVATVGHVGTALGAVGVGLGVPFAVEFCFLLMGLVPGASFASIPAWNASDADRARATGAIAQLGNLGTVTGTPVFVYAAVTGGLTAILVVLLTAAALGAVLAFTAGTYAARSPV
jgi:MFS family permease